MKPRQDIPRVFFDSNDGEPLGGYWLNFDLSKKDLQKIPDLRESAEVLLYMPNELEVEARLVRDRSDRLWLGIPDESTWRLLDDEKAS